jgi:hypothetical protein
MRTTGHAFMVRVIMELIYCEHGVKLHSSNLEPQMSLKGHFLPICDVRDTSALAPAAEV